MLAVLLAALVLGPTAPASAADVPWTDPNAHGALGLCDAAGHEVTSGRLDAKPFITTVVSSVAAPEGYDAQASAKGTLYAFQPRQGVDPGDWSGTQLTASSWYSNAAHPMAQGTALDYSLADYLSIYPAKWDGLVQLRLFVGAPNKQLVTSPYPATVLRVKDDSWEVVQGGLQDGADCHAGQVQSVEHRYLPASRFASASPSPGTSGTSTAAGGAGSSAGATGTSAGGASSSAAVSSTSTAHPSSSGTSWGIWGAAAGLVALGLLGLALRRRRTTTS